MPPQELPMAWVYSQFTKGFWGLLFRYFSMSATLWYMREYTSVVSG